MNMANMSDTSGSRNDFQLKMTLRDIELEPNQENLIGTGGFASVFTGKHKSTREIVAVKLLKNVGPGGLEKSVEKKFLQEAECMYRLSSKYVVHIHGILVQPDKSLYGIVMEYMELGSLLQLTQDIGDSLEWPLLLDILAQVVSGLVWMHRKRQGEMLPYTGPHGDIKAVNILITKNFTAKLSDFGLTKLKYISSQSTGQGLRGTVTHLSPEILEGTSRFNEKSDVWSFGVTIYEAAGGTPFSHLPAVNDLVFARHVCDKRGSPVDLSEDGNYFLKHMPTSVKDLIESCLQHEPANRPSFPDIQSVIIMIQRERYHDSMYKSALIKANQALQTLGTSISDQTDGIEITTKAKPSSTQSRYTHNQIVLIKEEIKKIQMREPPREIINIQNVINARSTDGNRLRVFHESDSGRKANAAFRVVLERINESIRSGKNPAERINESSGSGKNPAERINESSGSGKNPAERINESSGSGKNPAERINESSGSGKNPAERINESSGSGKNPVERINESSGSGKNPAERINESSGSGKNPAERINESSGSGKNPAERINESSGSGKNPAALHHADSSDPPGMTDNDLDVYGSDHEIYDDDLDYYGSDIDPTDHFDY